MERAAPFPGSQLYCMRPDEYTCASPCRSDPHKRPAAVGRRRTCRSLAMPQTHLVAVAMQHEVAPAAVDGQANDLEGRRWVQVHDLRSDSRRDPDAARRRRLATLRGQPRRPMASPPSALAASDPLQQSVCSFGGPTHLGRQDLLARVKHSDADLAVVERLDAIPAGSARGTLNGQARASARRPPPSAQQQGRLLPPQVTHRLPAASQAMPVTPCRPASSSPAMGARYKQPTRTAAACAPLLLSGRGGLLGSASGRARWPPSQGRVGAARATLLVPVTGTYADKAACMTGGRRTRCRYES